MSVEEIKKEIKKCIREIKGDYFDIEEQLITGGYISSSDFFQLLVMIERVFNVRFLLEDISASRFDDVDKIVEQVKTMTAETSE